MSSPFSSCCPGGRVIWVENGVKARAVSSFGFAAKPGENGRAAIVFGQSPPPGALARVNAPAGVAGAFPDHGVNTLPVVFGPQVGGLLRGAFWPPSMLIRKVAKGTCGRP